MLICCVPAIYTSHTLNHCNCGVNDACGQSVSIVHTILWGYVHDIYSMRVEYAVDIEIVELYKLDIALALL